MNDKVKSQVWRLMVATGTAGLGAAALIACHDTSEPAREASAPAAIAAAGALGVVAAVPAQELPEPPEDPCDGKVCGDTCQLCTPGEETCTEPLRHCDARGLCSHVPPACMAEEPEGDQRGSR